MASVQDPTWAPQPQPDTLQIPPDAPSSRRGGSSSRPASTAVYSSSTAPSSSIPVSASRKRASHSVTSSSTPHPADQFPILSDVYQHPAALAYAAAHPRRTIPKFGPYLLLQTLGEGEFGKVKLGLHGSWGEEVAVKLIRRGNIDSSVRMSKVEREIEVLKVIKHPNIVRLYDVIETDKYIGIILEYASGGELFDHILAHRYLKEKDACKLFAQLISGVAYIHAKKIVHRDLKLENLLLDRNRNVLITDFGFANRFEHKADDLMQTSCGSPCYAAPELVISEGLYVGSAVDIWSCGVILYAMLAGYLPFDDDPANPDGDNINLLYKYIINTQLTFPDYISEDARDLLKKMLVPDPAKRSDLKTIMAHRWLKPYAHLFVPSVEELEKQALDQQTQKRLAYQRQIRARDEQSRHIPRSHSARHDNASRRTRDYVAAHSIPPSSTNPEFLYDTSDPSQYPPVPSPQATSSRRAVASAIVMPSSSNQPEDPFYVPREMPADDLAAMGEGRGETRSRKESGKSRSSKKSAKAHHGSSSEKKKKTGGYRHTIQLEYDDGGEPEPIHQMPPRLSTAPADVLQYTNGTESLPSASPIDGEAVSPITPLDRESDVEMTSADVHVSEAYPAQNGIAIPNDQSGAMDVDQPVSTTPPTTPRKKSGASNVTVTGPLPTGPAPPLPSSPVVTPRARVGASSSSPTLHRSTTDEPTTPTSKRQPDGATETSSATTPLPIPAPPSVIAPTPTASPTKTPAERAPAEPSPSEITIAATVSSGSSGKSRHRKGMSIDKFGFGKLLQHGKDSPLDAAHTSNSSPATEKAPSLKHKSSSSLAKVEREGSIKSAKKSRRKTLSLMVEPFSKSKDRKTRSVTVPSGQKEELTPSVPPPPATLPKATAPLPTATKSAPTQPAQPTPNWRLPFRDSVRLPASDDMNGMAPTGSTKKSQKVMDWFRMKSLSRGMGNAKLEEPRAIISGAQTYREPTANGTQPPVHVVVTSPDSTSWTPSATPRSASGSQSQRSDVTDATTSTGAGAKSSDSTVMRAARKIAAVALVPTPPAPVSRSGFNNNLLRVHHGAVDQATITNGSPPEVFEHVTRVLYEMGIDVQKESEYKYRCIRHKRKKLTSAGMGLRDPSSSSGGLTAFTMIGSAGSNGVDKRGLPVPSHPSAFGGPGGMLKGLLLRRGPSQSPATPPIPVPSMNFDAEGGDTPGSNSSLGHSPEASVPLPSSSPEPIYGDRTVDQADEVRFYVELTRIDRLEDTYSLDIRRLKGNLRSYKFLYDTLRERCNFNVPR